MKMKELRSMLYAGAVVVLVAGCAKQPAPPAPGPPAATMQPWKLDFGPTDAKVVVECFYPTEGHEWVQELNNKILKKHPAEVRIEYINWQRDEGLRMLEEKKLEPCGQYLVNGRVVVKKSQALGNWTDDDLLIAVDKAVKEAYGVKTSQAASNIVVHVPCGLAGPYGELRDGFVKENPTVKLKAQIANTLVLCDRIEKGENADVFLCMGSLELQPLEAKKRLVAGSERTLARTSLSLIVPANNPGNVKSLQDIKGAKVRRIALGDPKTISVGKESVDALKKAGLWESVKDRVQFVREAATLKTVVAEGKSHASLVYTSCLQETHDPGKEPKKLPIKTICEIPLDLYNPVAIVGVAVASGAAGDAGRQFIAYCARPASQKIFEKWGFLKGSATS